MKNRLEDQRALGTLLGTSAIRKWKELNRKECGMNDEEICVSCVDANLRKGTEDTYGALCYLG